MITRFQTALLFVLPLLAVHASGNPQARVSTFLEDPAQAGRGSVALFDEATGALSSMPAELQNLRLLDLELARRTRLSEQDPLAAQRFDDVPGAARISLPSGLGCLYRFERVEVGRTTFGFLHFDVQGTPRTLAEISSTRKDAPDPFFKRVAVAPDGTSFLVATKYRAGGNLLEVEIATGMVFDHTLHAPPQRIKPRGIALGNNWGLAVTPTGVLRFQRGKKSLALPVAFPTPTPSYYGDTIALSSNTDWALVTAGRSGFEAHTFAFGATGAAVQVSEQASRISRGGFLPEHPNGPYLAISDDGKLAAWRQEMTDPMGEPSTELFLARVPTTVPAPAEQLSSDARYLDTLDEVGQIFFLDPTRLAYVIGEKELEPDGLGMSNVDLFIATLPAGPGAPQILNLSRTNGQQTPPFTLPPEMKPKQIAWLPSEQSFLVYDDGTAEALVAIDSTLGSFQVILDEVKDVGLFETTPSGFLFDARRTDAAGGNWELMRHTGSLLNAPNVVATSATDNSFGRGASRTDGTVSFIGAPTGLERLSRVGVLTGTLQSLQGFVRFGPVLGYSPNGSLAFTGLTPAGATEFGLWKSDGSMMTLATPAGATGFVLAGR